MTVLLIAWLWFFGGWGWCSFFKTELAEGEPLYLTTRVFITIAWPILSVAGVLRILHRHWMRIGTSATPE